MTGTFRILAPALPPSTPCVPLDQAVGFKDMVDANDLLTLTSDSFSGSVAVLTVQLPLNPANVAKGNVTITGGACALATQSLFARLVPPVTGTYTGTLAPPQFLGQPSSNTGGPATIALTQAPARADGQFPVTATISYASPSCTLSATVSGTISGITLRLGFPDLSNFPTLGFLAPVSLVGILTSDSNGLFSSVLVRPGTKACAESSYSGKLQRQ